jgi:hypothetical protein
MTREVLVQEGGRCESSKVSKAAQLAVVLLTGMATTNVKSPSSAGKLWMEAKRDWSHSVWAG